MLARCYRCQSTFQTERFGTQTCPSCGAEVHLPEPGAEAQPPPPLPPAAPPQQPPAGGQAAGEGSAPGWGAAPPGWGAPPGYQPPPGWGGPPGWGAPGWGPVPPGAVPPPAEQSAPFAERSKRGFFSAFVETWKLAALEPTRFFRQVRVGESGSAVIFGLVAFTLGTWVSLAFRYATASATMGFVARFTHGMSGRVDAGPWLQMMRGVTVGGFLAQLAATPFFALAALYLTAGVIHLLLLVVRGAPRGFDATLTVVGYAFGILLLQAVPVCGGLVAAVWFLVVAIQGLAEAQRCGSSKASFAVLGPLLLGCVCACLAGLIAGIAGFSGLSGLTGAPPGSTGL